MERNTPVICGLRVSVFLQILKVSIYLKILGGIGTLETEMSCKSGSQNSMSEESWIPSLCLCDTDVLHPPSLELKNHYLKCKWFLSEGKTENMWKLG